VLSKLPVPINKL